MRYSVTALTALTALTLLSCLLLAGCKTNDRTSNNYKRKFTPALVTEDDIIKVSLRQVHHKRDNLRIALTLENKTEQTLVLRYGNFIAVHQGEEIPGALRVPFARVTRSFPMEPGMVKRIGPPIEFIGVPEMALSTTVEIRDIELAGADEKSTSTFAFDVPIRK